MLLVVPGSPSMIATLELRDRTQHQLSVQFSGLYVVGSNSGNDLDAICLAHPRNELVDVNNRKVFATNPGQDAVEEVARNGVTTYPSNCLRQPALQDIELLHVCFFFGVLPNTSSTPSFVCA
jgi:hypothetical protein